jgi:hypothetical protein
METLKPAAMSASRAELTDWSTTPLEGTFTGRPTVVDVTVVGTLVAVDGTVVGRLVAVEGLAELTRRLNKLACGRGTKNTTRMAAATATTTARWGQRRDRCRRMSAGENCDGCVAPNSKTSRTARATRSSVVLI